MSRKETMKVYHGIPKSITDEHTIFYASFDGTIEPKIGEYTSNFESPIFLNSITGYGVSNKVFETNNRFKGFFNALEEWTIDLFLDISTIINYSTNNLKEQYGLYLGHDKKNKICLLSWENSNNKQIRVRIYDDNGNTVHKEMLPLSLNINHIRVSYSNELLKYYINGIQVFSYNKFKTFNIDFLLIYQMQCIISDLHVSNIDRGDYFPNLPQDFIDSKAIIKPRLGQQQIKGDPLYSQYTLDKVKIGTNVNEPQITCSRTSGQWASNDTIKVKGLNGEIISGVIDSDTALCGIVKVDMTNYLITVDSLNGITNGDVVRVRANTGAISTVDRYIKIVDHTNNIVELHSASNLTSKIEFGADILGGAIFETTASSSSPVVKTEDGTVVAGTWTGLGTNEATFTLGNNSNIAGKDLYVEYSLNISNNNSDFNELPYNIDKAWTENGIEMTPVNDIVITDDFNYKIKNSNEQCPHFAGICMSNELSQVSSFTEYDIYNWLYNKNGLLCKLTTNESGKVPQHLFIFDLIEIIERKLGCEIPTINKIQWIKENVTKISVNHYGYGEGPNGNKIYMKVLNNGEWIGNGSHNSSITTNKTFYWTGTGNIGNIDNGKISFLVYTDASDGTTASTVYTDYISIEITLKIDSTFTTLYCKNTRAREDKCNPVLIQKETKTVKRYLPSKEYFTTECKYVKMNNNLLSTSEMNNYHYKGTKVYSTTRGSGKYSKSTGIFPNIINLLRIPNYKAYEYMCESLKESPVTSKENMSLTEQLGESYCGNTLSAMPTELYDVQKYIQLVPFIRLNNGEIELMLYSSELINSGKIDYPKQMTKDCVYAYKLPNRPLIK